MRLSAATVAALVAVLSFSSSAPGDGQGNLLVKKSCIKGRCLEARFVPEDRILKREPLPFDIRGDDRKDHDHGKDHGKRPRP
ncbi:hypothetical protein DFH07DRAFT_971642 [Mycena maculata]|uniref:Uncharacterized protein n=1 Tax=Mycena maculata TaxID=230809 RepID=A0AAD7MLY0_9AGAR|nr:hypothetical protein DFH07DRAFT_971642 [Mycena maculata]